MSADISQDGISLKPLKHRPEIMLISYIFASNVLNGNAIAARIVIRDVFFFSWKEEVLYFCIEWKVGVYRSRFGL